MSWKNLERAAEIGSDTAKGLLGVQASKAKAANEQTKWEIEREDKFTIANNTLMAELKKLSHEEQTSFYSTVLSNATDRLKVIDTAMIADSSNMEAFKPMYDIALNDARVAQIQYENHVRGIQPDTAVKDNSIIEMVNAAFESAGNDPSKLSWNEGHKEFMLKANPGVDIKTLEVEWRKKYSEISRKKIKELKISDKEHEKLNRLWKEAGGGEFEDYSATGRAPDEPFGNDVIGPGELLLSTPFFASRAALGRIGGKAGGKIVDKIDKLFRRPGVKAVEGSKARPIGDVNRQFGLESLEKFYPGGVAGTAAVRGGLTKLSKGLLGAGAAWQYLTQDASASDRPDVSAVLSSSGPVADGASPKLLDQSAVQDLQTINRQFGAGTGGLMQFVDDINKKGLSEKARDFLDRYISAVQQVGKEQAAVFLQDMYKLLSESEKESIIDALVKASMVQPSQSRIPDDFRELSTNEYGQLVPTDGSLNYISDDFRDMRRDQYGNFVETYPSGGVRNKQ